MSEHEAGPEPVRLADNHFRLEVDVINEMGLHARPASLVVGITTKYPCEVTIQNGNTKVDGKSILSLLSLSAEMGTRLTIEARGEKARELLQELNELVENGFHDPPAEHS